MTHSTSLPHRTQSNGKSRGLSILCSALRARRQNTFFWLCMCFECRKHKKNRITPTRTHIPFAAVNMRYESVYRFEHIVAYSSGKVVAKSDLSCREIAKRDT